MKKFFLLVFLVSALAIGCSSPKNKAIELNNKIADCVQNMGVKGNELGMAINAATSTKDFTKVKGMAASLKAYADEQLSEISALKNVGGSEKIKSATVDYLKFEKAMLDEALAPFMRMDSTTTEDELQDAMLKLIDKSKDENSYVERIKKEQKEYADKNGFKLDAPKK